MWNKVKKGANIGKQGSENGIIIYDEEYQNSCRLTLEKCEKYYAVTCSVYERMVHTAFGKEELQEFIDSNSTEDEEFSFYEDFTTKY